MTDQDLQKLIESTAAGLAKSLGGQATSLTPATGTPPPYAAPAPGLASAIDHTLLKPTATPDQIVALCAEARQHEFASVCVNSGYVGLCAEQLAGSPVRVCTVVGFPLGAGATAAKAYEAEHAVDDGAEEIDMVINLGLLLSGAYAAVRDDIAAVVEVCEDKIVKVILETVFLDDAQKVAASIICRAAGAHFVKTSTGFSGGGATADDIRLMRAAVGTALGVKASGGVRDAETARAMMAAGANRIGTSSGVAIVGGAAGTDTY